MYRNAVRTAIGDRPDWEDDIPDEAFEKYVRRSSPALVDSATRRDSAGRDVVATYERWVRELGGTGHGTSAAHGSGHGPGGATRKVTGDYTFVG